MSKNLSEPGINKSAAANEWQTRQLLRRPAPSVTGSGPPWMAVFDNFYYGQEISTTAAGTNLQFPFCDWSDNAAGIFDYVRSASTIGANNSYNIQLLVDGVYTFSWEEIAEDLGTSNYSVRYYLDVNMYYPGRNASQASIIDSVTNTMDFQDAAGTARSYSQTYFYYTRSITLPCQTVGGPGTVYPSITVLRPSSASNFSITFRNRLWVTYHGPLAHTIGLTAGDHEIYDPYECDPAIHPGDTHTTNCPP